MIYNTIYIYRDTLTIYDRCGNPKARNYQYSIAIGFSLYIIVKIMTIRIHRVYIYMIFVYGCTSKLSDKNVILFIIPSIWYSFFKKFVCITKSYIVRIIPLSYHIFMFHEYYFTLLRSHNYPIFIASFWSVSSLAF